MSNVKCPLFNLDPGDSSMLLPDSGGEFYGNECRGGIKSRPIHPPHPRGQWWLCDWRRIMIRHFKLAAILVLLMMGAALHAHAQVSAGAVLGTVSDASGALIPGVTITVTNEGTNQSRQSITNESGSYRVEPLQ